MAKSQLIRESSLRERLDEIDIDDVNLSVVGVPQGWAIQFDLNGTERVLATARGELRKFASLDTAAKFAIELGHIYFDVDASKYEGGLTRGARPDRAAALKLAHNRAKS